MGRELFAPNQSGSIISNDILRKGDQKADLTRRLASGINSFKSDSSSGEPNQDDKSQRLRNLLSGENLRRARKPAEENSPLTSNAAVSSRREANTGAASIRIEIPVNVVTHGGDGGNVDQKTIAMLRREMQLIVRDELQPDRLAQMVEMAANRDSERT